MERYRFTEVSRPMPISDLRHIFEMLSNILMMFVQLSVEHIDYVGSLGAQSWNILQSVDGKVETTHLIQHNHIERRGRCTAVHITAHVEAALIRSPMHHRMNQPAIVMKCKDDRRVLGEERVERHVVHSMRMLVGHHEYTQIHNIDHSHLDAGNILLQQP